MARIVEKAARRVWVQTSYGEPIVAKLKELGAKWDPERKLWWVGTAKLAQVEELLVEADQTEDQARERGEPTPVPAKRRSQRDPSPRQGPVQGADLKSPPPNARLVGGPYRLPRLEPGSLVTEATGRIVRVWHMSDAPIPWPLGKPHMGGRFCPILCGDLVEAVRVESVYAVAHHWSVSYWTANRWRGWLGVPRFNPGTQRLWARSRAERCGR